VAVPRRPGWHQCALLQLMKLNAPGEEEGTSFQPHQADWMDTACVEGQKATRETIISPVSSGHSPFGNSGPCKGVSHRSTFTGSARTRCVRSGVRLLIFLMGTWGFLIGGDQTEKFVHWLRSNRHSGDAPSNQFRVAEKVPHRNVGLEVNISLALAAQSLT